MIEGVTREGKGRQKAKYTEKITKFAVIARPLWHRTGIIAGVWERPFPFRGCR